MKVTKKKLMGIKLMEKEKVLKELKAMKRNVSRRKGQYATARDIELMTGY